jgi:hypothetical protein
MVPIGIEAQVEVIQERCTVCAEHTIDSKIILDAPDGTLRRRGSNGISILSLSGQCYCRCKIGARFVPNVPSAQKLFWTHPMELLGVVGHVESRFFLFGGSVSVGAWFALDVP